MWNTLFGESTSLFDEFNWLSREMDRLFEPMGIPALRTAGSGFPAVNVATEDDKVHVLVFAPGIAPGRLDVSILGNVLTVQGRRELPNGQTQIGCVAGSFYQHNEDYRGPQAASEWRGLVVKHEVANGDYDPMFVSLDFLRKRYG